METIVLALKLLTGFVALLLIVGAITVAFLAWECRKVDFREGGDEW
jgi:hypothetical protein